MAGALLGTLYSGPVLSVGVYEDPGRFSSFVRASRRPLLRSQAIRTDAQAHDATLYILSGHIPVKSRLLLQPQLSFVSLAGSDEIEDGFGDFQLWFRMRVWAGGGRGLFWVSSFRSGSGSSRLFPYSTASQDYGAGLAYVDTLGTMTFWASGMATYTTRVRTKLENADLHPDYHSVAGGIVMPVTKSFAVELGGLGYLFDESRSRQLYFLDIGFDYSESIGLFVRLEGEGGDREERAVDFAIGGGMKITY